MSERRSKKDRGNKDQFNDTPKSLLKEMNICKDNSEFNTETKEFMAAEAISNKNSDQSQFVSSIPKIKER